MKKLFLLCAIAFITLFATVCQAIPARPGKQLIKQPDGSSLEVYLRGDEFLHYYVTTDNVILQQTENGYWNYAVLSADGSIIPGRYMAKNEDLRPTEELAYIKEINRSVLNQVLSKEAVGNRSKMRKVAPGKINCPFPTTGMVRGLVILAQYQDVKFSEKASLDVFKDLVNKEGYHGDLASGSVRDYFIDQSGGLFTPEFDVVGPVTLPQERAFYGNGRMSGEKAGQMVIDACQLADKEFDVNFTRYDRNEDDMVDFIYVVYAGYGEAQGGPSESVWPQSGSLEYDYYKTIDGMYLGSYSCSNELRENEGEEIDGIGTFCHEFSHILGLPDIYDAGGTGALGLRYWDVMDVGSYNNDSKTPAGFTAMDKYTVGWMIPTVLEEPQAGISLEALSSSNKAYFIVNPKNPDEYYTLENRQPEGWDAKLPGSGLLICHIDYKLSTWNMNRVNSYTSGHEHVMLVSADGNETVGEPGDVFPGTSDKTEFTDTSKPAATWWTGGKVGKPIRNIKEENGVIYFDFITDGTGIETLQKQDVTVRTEKGQILVSNPNNRMVRIYSIDSRQITAFDNESAVVHVNEGIYVIKVGDNAMKVCVKN